uniref:glucuronosyltransferase n=1 Tax=Plectus sambesii TaxID=2011161 RepID=A0A914USR4_9BILA
MGRLADTLIHAGHEVTLFLPELDPRANKTGSKLATEIRVPGKNPEGFLKAFTQRSPFEEQELMSVSAFKSMFQFMDLMEAECEHLVTSAPLMDRLRQSKFDLIIIEMYDYCGFGIAHLLGIPSRIWMSSMPLTEQMSAALGVPWPTSYIPGIFTAMSDRMSYSERFKNFIGVNLVVQLTLRTVVSQEQSVFDRNFGADFPRLWDLAGTTPVVFVNSEELLDFPRPILHKTIYMGGLGMEAPKKLDK